MATSSFFNLDTDNTLSANSDNIVSSQKAIKAYVDGKSFPSQTGQSGKYLTTDGTNASWANVDALPSQTGQQGKYLTTNGTTASWDIPMAGLPMFYATYQPRKLNNASWLRADPYSWHNADMYVSAYAHLVDDIDGVTAETESIYTRFVQPILSADGTLGGDSFAVACSSALSGREAYKSFDGNGTTKWGVSNTSGGWLTFYNPKALRVNSITYFPSSDYPTEDGGDLTIYGSNDNSTWTSLWTGTYTANTQSTFNVNSQAFYKYYKIEITNPTSNYAGLGDLHISADELVASITYYRAADEIKVVLPDQETNLDTIYNATGIGYYFILDTTNQRFKLPRNMYGFTGLRTNAGDYVSESLPNITGTIGGLVSAYEGTGAFTTEYNTSTGQGGGGETRKGVFDASRSSSAYSNGAPVQQRAVQAYLYFFVGNTIQNETSVNVAELAEDLNGKADRDLANLSNGLANTICTTNPTTTSTATSAKPAVVVENYDNTTSWYRVYSDGWCEQGGRTFHTNNVGVIATITLLKTMKDTNYSVSVSSGRTDGAADAARAIGFSIVSSSSFIITVYTPSGFTSQSTTFSWQVSGYIS